MSARTSALQAGDGRMALVTGRAFVLLGSGRVVVIK